MPEHEIHLAARGSLVDHERTLADLRDRIVDQLTSLDTASTAMRSELEVRASALSDDHVLRVVKSATSAMARGLQALITRITSVFDDEARTTTQVLALCAAVTPMDEQATTLGVPYNGYSQSLANHAPSDERRPVVDARQFAVDLGLPPHGHQMHGTANVLAVFDTPMGRLVARAPRPDGRQLLDRLGFRRVWDEAELLQRIGPHLSWTPTLLYASDGIQVQPWMSGVWPEPSGRLAERMSVVMADIARISRDQLPDLPTDWPADGDTPAFASKMVDDIEQSWLPHRPQFDEVIQELGFPASADLLALVRERAAALHSRPFGLVHGDLHLENVFMTPEPKVIDWETAMYGDTLHDLAVHRFYYQPADALALDRHWAAALGPRYGQHLAADLPCHQLIAATRRALLATPLLLDQLRAVSAEPAQLQPKATLFATRFSNAVNIVNRAVDPGTPAVQASDMTARLLRASGTPE